MEKINCNPQLRTVYVELDRERALRYTTNGICEAERLGGFAIGEVLAEGLTAKINLSRIRLLLFALVHHEDPGISLERLGEVIDDTPDKKLLFDSMGLALTLGMSADPNAAYASWTKQRLQEAKIRELQERIEAGDKDAEKELEELVKKLSDDEEDSKKK